MWEISRGMVWAISDCQVYPVRTPAPGLPASRIAEPVYTRRLTRVGITRMLSNTQEPPTLRVYVTKDTSDVYEEQFIRLASNQSGQIQPTLILMGVRLGIDHVTSVYWDGLQEALQYPQSVGIAG